MTGRPFSALTSSKAQAVVLHHTAGPESVGWVAIARYHVQSRGFAGIGHHVGVREGRMAYLGDLDTARAHVKDQNHRYLGLCMAGNYEAAHPSGATNMALRAPYDAMCEWLGRTVSARSHQDLAPPRYTVCAGRNLKARLGELMGGADETLHLALRKWADVGQAIQPNEAAALYRQMRGDGYWPLSARGEKVVGHPAIVAQLGREWSGTGERVYFWDGRRVRWVTRR